VSADKDRTAKTAWAFAGQGAQYVGMGRDLYDAFADAKEIYDSNAAGFSLTEVSFDGCEASLADTRYTQACIAAFQACVVKRLQKAGLRPDYALGLSLGEYAALHAAAVFDAETLLRLTGRRGALMAEASSVPAKMVAILGLDDATVEECVAKARVQSQGIVACANYNCPEQLVIGGEQGAVDRAVELLTQAGARRCVPLKTSGGFHTPLMQAASDEFALVLAAVELAPQRFPIIFNVTARTAADDEARALLARQMYSPVRFTQSVRYLAEQGVARIVEIGPGNVLRGLIRRIAPTIEVLSISDKKQLEEVVSRWQL
jgi:[acyl-carrier-protein] S-malonyltransferase